MQPDPLFDVLRAYATLQPPRSIERPDASFSTIHDFLLHHLLLNPHFADYPPSRQYQIAFWKWSIEWLEGLMSGEACYLLHQPPPMYAHVLMRCVLEGRA